MNTIKRESILEVCREWKHFWMNQKGNSEEDRIDYFNRGFGIDANMLHNIADRIFDLIQTKTLETSINTLKPNKVIMVFESENENKIYCQSCQSEKVTLSKLSEADQYKFLLECHSCGELWKE